MYDDPYASNQSQQPMYVDPAPQPIQQPTAVAPPGGGYTNGGGMGGYGDQASSMKTGRCLDSL